MAKDKSTKKAAAPAKTETVKSGRVAKPAEASKKVAKETAKSTAKAIEKKKKKAKEPTPEPESESESESEADDATSQSSESSGSDSEEEAPAPKTNGAAKAAKAADSDDDSDDSESESESESEEEKVAAPKANGVNGKAKAEDSDDSDSDSESDQEEEPAKTEASDDDSDSDDSSDEEEEEEAKPAAEEKSNKKRKAESAVEATPKRAKVMVDGEEKEPVANLFIGQLSWNVDEEWLTREFEGFGEIAGVRIITDRDSGRSKGYGYVEFVEVDSAIKALEEMSGKELDGRALRVDFSVPRAARDNNSTPQQRSNDRAQKYGDSTKEPTSTLWVGNISFDADENTLTEAFQPYGTIKAIRLPTDRDTGAPKGFGYIEMESLEDAKSAFASCQGMEVAGRALRLDYAGERSNDSAGGGFGGGRGGRGGGGFGGRGGGRGRGGDRGRGGFGRGGGGRGGGFGGRGGKPSGTNRGGFGDFSGKKTTF